MRLCALIVCWFALSQVAGAVGTTLEDIAQKAATARAAEAKQDQARETAFKQAYAKAQTQLNEALAARTAAEARSNALSSAFDANLTRIAELEVLLEEHQGNLGELFGVTRQIAGDAASELRQSQLATRFASGAADADRETFLNRLATAKALPSIDELNRLWFELQREMTASGSVVRHTAPVRSAGADAVEREVVTVGPFTASAGDVYLGFVPGEKLFSEFARQPPARERGVARALAQAPSDGYVEAVVDPARGSLLALYVGRPDWRERIEVGGMIGYITIAIGVLGALLWLAQLVYLLLVRAAVAWQVRHPAQPSRRNPLGRLLLAFNDGAARGRAGDVAELEISAAVLREVPRLERFQSLLRLVVAAGPLLGLIGTVIGMIITFQSITAAGATDPKLVAHGIGQAMIATVLGLGIAIPLLFANSLLSGLSRAIIQILDERGEGLLAANLRVARGA
jgi:biopolymer transport protein ExbB